MTKRSRGILTSTLGLLTLVVLIRLACINMPPPLTEEGKMKSPDGLYTATFRYKEYQPFLGGELIDCIALSVKSTDGRVIRRITTEEPTAGWVEGTSLEWAKDSSSVTLVFKYTSGLPRTRVILSVKPWDGKAEADSLEHIQHSPP